jgi:rod shape-determining protein MreD
VAEVRRTVLSAVAIVLALLLQLSLVDRLPLPGGGAPDLVLLVVVALGLTGGPVAGMLTGFWAGLALDIAPPAGYLLGEHALVFCLVGYACGRLSGITERSAASSLGIAAMAAAGGEVLQVIVGLMFGDPGVSWPAIQVVLPSAVLQDILVSPFVVYLVMLASSWAAGRRLGSAAGAAMPGPLAGLLGAGRARLADGAVLGAPGGSGWLAGSPGSGRGGKPGALSGVRFGSYAARQGDGWVGSGPRSWRAAGSQVSARPPRIRPAAGQAGSATAGQVRRQRPASPVSIRLGSGRRGGGSVGTAFLGGRPGRRALGGAGGWPGRRPRFRPGGGAPGGLGSAGPGSAGPGGTGLRGNGRGGTGLGSAGLRGNGRGGSGRGGSGRGSAGLRSAGFRSAGLGSSAGLSSGAAGSQLRRGGAARVVSLRLRGGRRGARVLSGRFRTGLRGGSSGGGFAGGLAGGSASRPALRLASQRSARRFRSRAAGAARSPRQPSFRPGRRSSLVRVTTRKSVGRPAWWRIGRRRTGGFS